MPASSSSLPQSSPVLGSAVRWSMAAAAAALLVALMSAAGYRQRSVDVVSAAIPVAPDTQRVLLGVKGMSCQSCERTITVMLARTPGVIRTTVSVERGEAVVLYDAARIAPAKLIAVIEQLGYSATIKKSKPDATPAREPLQSGRNTPRG